MAGRILFILNRSYKSGTTEKIKSKKIKGSNFFYMNYIIEKSKKYFRYKRYFDWRYEETVARFEFSVKFRVY